MPKLMPFRQYSDHDVINGWFTWSGTVPVNDGTIVKVEGSGVQLGANTIKSLGAPSYSVTNVDIQRYGVNPVVSVASTGDKPVGMLLYEVREFDENGDRLLWNKRKAIENDWVISGKSTPIATAGLFIYSGVAGRGTTNVYVSGGQLTTENGGFSSNTDAKVGYVLGTPVNNTALVKLAFN